MNLNRLDLDGIDDVSLAFIRDVFSKTGAVLLRLNQADLENFERLTRGLCNDFHEVGTRQALRQQAGDGYTTEVFRDNFILLGHAEGTYRPYPPPPEICFFMCITAPVAAGGETTVIDGAAMLRAIPEPLRSRLEEQGVVYECLWEEARWQAEFGVQDLNELYVLLESLPALRFSVHQHTLHLFVPAPAIISARDGQKVFVNSILTHLHQITHPRYADLPVYTRKTNHVYFGDNGELLSEKDINALIDAHDQVLHRHRWQPHDILILDNTRYMHGRELTVAPCERVLISRFGRLQATL